MCWSSLALQSDVRESRPSLKHRYFLAFDDEYPNAPAPVHAGTGSPATGRPVFRTASSRTSRSLTPALAPRELHAFMINNLPKTPLQHALVPHAHVHDDPQQTRPPPVVASRRRNDRVVRVVERAPHPPNIVRVLAHVELIIVGILNSE